MNENPTPQTPPVIPTSPPQPPAAQPETPAAPVAAVSAPQPTTKKGKTAQRWAVISGLSFLVLMACTVLRSSLGGNEALAWVALVSIAAGVISFFVATGFYIASARKERRWVPIVVTLAGVIVFLNPYSLLLAFFVLVSIAQQ